MERVDIEDVLQTCISKMLPNFDKTRIRPSYQNDADFALNGETVVGDTVGPITKYDNVIYFYVKFDTLSEDSYVYENGLVDNTVGIDLIVDIYGPNNEKLARTIKSLIRADYITYYLASKDLYLLNVDTLDAIKEIVNEEWWERTQVTIHLNKKIDIDVEQTDLNVEAEKAQLGDINDPDSRFTSIATSDV